MYGECGSGIVPGFNVTCCAGAKCTPAQTGAPPVCIPATNLDDDDDQPISPPPTTKWNLTWSDEFNTGSTLNPKKWNVANNFTHCYPPDFCPEHQLYLQEAVTIQNGRLVINTKKNNVIGKQGEKKEFTSGWIDTKGLFTQKYGRFEANCSLPSKKSTGIWPAFWLLPTTLCWPTGGEVDIFEFGGNGLEDDVFGSYHWGATCGKDKFPIPGRGYRPKNSTVDWQTKFHVYAIEWSISKIDFYVDEELYYTRPASVVALPTESMYVIFDQAVGGLVSPSGGEYPSSGVAMEVEYVRVYSAVV